VNIFSLVTPNDPKLFNIAINELFFEIVRFMVFVIEVPSGCVSRRNRAARTLKFRILNTGKGTPTYYRWAILYWALRK